jgi:hypothetical protein
MVGTDGAIYHAGMRPNSPRLFPEEKWTEYRANPEKRVPKTLPRVEGGIMGNWLDGIRDGKKACSDFSYSATLTEVILLGTLAIRTGKALNWDAESMKISDNPEAAEMLKVPARKGWRTEDLS